MDLYRNNDYINSAYANSPSTWASHGNTAILKLKAGDRITVSGRPDTMIVVEGDYADEQLYATLTAYLLNTATHGNNGNYGCLQTLRLIWFDGVFDNISVISRRLV